jgi:hypothetical protein
MTNLKYEQIEGLEKRRKQRVAYTKGPPHPPRIAGHVFVLKYNT